MAHDVKIEVYTFQIRKKRERDPKYLTLKDFFKGNDFLEFFIGYCDDLQSSLKTFDTYNRAIRLKSKTVKHDSKSRTVRGIFESGAYGFESSILDNNTEHIVHVKEKNQTEILPFYFLLHVPEKLNIGYLFLQRFGVFGVNTVFNASFRKFFDSKFSDFIVDFNPHVSKELADEFLSSGNIKEIVLRRMNLPTDLSDKLNLSEYHDAIHSIEIKIKSKRKKSFGGFGKKVKSFLKDTNAVLFDIPELRNLGFDGAHNISVVSKVSGNTRTIDLADTGNIRPYYDINKDVVFASNGFPTFKSIDEAALNLLLDFTGDLNKKK